MAETRFEYEDPILPTRITHDCERIWDGDDLEQVYNFLDYEFETEKHSYRARAHLDTIDKVSVYGPFRPGTSDPIPGSHQIDERILAYLRRRYSKLLKLGLTGYEAIH